MCHSSHKSQFPALLTKAQRELCLRCHVEPGLLDLPFHKAAGDKDCSACHDPHMAGNRLLLVDSGTFRRRRIERNTGSVHAPWKARKCDACHVPEQSNALVADIDKVCLTCHKKVLEGLDHKKAHKAVLDGKCSACHSGHKSPNPHLIRPSGCALPAMSLRTSASPDIRPWSGPIACCVIRAMRRTGDSF